MEHDQAVHNLAVECLLYSVKCPPKSVTLLKPTTLSVPFTCGRSPRCLAVRRGSAGYLRLGARAAIARPNRFGHTVALVLAWLVAAAICHGRNRGAWRSSSAWNLLGTIPSLHRRLDDASAPRIVNSTFLRPQTRGEPTPLRTVSGEPAVFIFDLPESPTSELRFIVKSNRRPARFFQLAGKVSGRGEQVTLSIPRLDLPAGTYTLVAESAAADGRELAQYPFEVNRP